MKHIIVAILSIFGIAAFVGGSPAAAGTQSPPAESSASNTDTYSMLEHGNVAALESMYSAIQARFEQGWLTEFALRNAFRSFYELDSASVTTLQKWVSDRPTSYVAHLAYGIYLKRLGSVARGEAYVQDTSPERLRESREYYNQSKVELEKSLVLTARPYLSYFHLLTISMEEGNQEASRKWLTSANKILPSNSLARNRFASSLLPRWGGSYTAFEAFIRESQLDGASPATIMQLKAIEEDDKGASFEEAQNRSAASEHYVAALKLGKEAGGSFRGEFLVNALSYLCGKPSALDYCN